MTGPRIQIHRLVSVVSRPLVLVQHAQPDRRAQSDAELRARLDLDPVLLVARRRDGALARTPPRQLGLDVEFGESHAWWAAIDDTADGATVRFAVAEAREVSEPGSRSSGRWDAAHVVTRKCWPKVDMVDGDEIIGVLESI